MASMKITAAAAAALFDYDGSREEVGRRYGKCRAK